MRFLTAVVMTHSVTNTLPRTVMRHGVTAPTLQAEQDTSVRWCVYNHQHFLNTQLFVLVLISTLLAEPVVN